MSEELKPCPFCGNPITIDEGQIGGWVMQHHATDEECPLSTDLDGGTAPIQLIYSNKKSLINVINTRPVEDELRAELARRDEQIAELTATTHSQAVRNAELLRFVWWVYQVYARNVQELTSGITEACTYETEEKAEKGKYGLPIRCWEYIRYLEEYTAGIYNGTYLDSETSTGVKDPPAGHWKSHVEPKELE